MNTDTGETYAAMFMAMAPKDRPRVLSAERAGNLIGHRDQMALRGETVRLGQRELERRRRRGAAAKQARKRNR